MPRVYLDNAATSWPKPPAVYDAVDGYQRENGAAVGRSSTRAATALQKTVDRCRRDLATLVGARSPQSILFGFNGTDVLNMVLHGWLRSGDHVVTTSAEHNSVLRPLQLLKMRLGIEVDYVDVDIEGRINPADVRAALRPGTRLIALTHASNVTGTIQPVAEVGAFAREAGIPFLLDAAQTAGHLPINVEELQVDFLATPGHKGLLGPLGTGVLYVRPGRENELIPLRQGGTGTASDSEEIAAHGPDRFEAGNHNAPGLVGLAAGVGWILDQGLDRLRAHEIALTTRLLERLTAIPSLRILGPKTATDRVGTVSLQLEMLDPQTTASLLESEFGIEARAGLHCAPRMHAALGSDSQGGTVRLSMGPFTTPEEIDAVAEALQSLGGA